MKRGIALVAGAVMALSVVLPVAAQTLLQEVGMSAGNRAISEDTAIQKAVQMLKSKKEQKILVDKNQHFVKRHRSTGNTVITGGAEAFPL